MTDLTPQIVDQNLIDGAVDFINRTARSASLQMATAISEYIVDSFFGGDFNAISSKDPHKTASFAALCARQDLQIPATTLNRLVRIGHQVRQMPQDLAEKLSMTQHRALLSVVETPHKQKLARQTIKHAWTVEQLKQNIAAEKPPKSHPLGRPAKATALKWMTALQKPAAMRAEARRGRRKLPRFQPKKKPR